MPSPASHRRIGYTLVRDVTPVGVFQRRIPGRVREMVRTRSLARLRTQRHRSGWPVIVSALADRADADGLLLDDFVERTFRPQGRNEHVTWSRPWMGIFHYPPNFPTWFQDYAHPASILSSPRFNASRPHLRGAVALSDHLASWLRTQLDVPVHVVRHPTEFTAQPFSWDAFADNPDKQLVQVGWFLRNYRAIHQVQVPGDFRKARIAQDRTPITHAEARTDAFSPVRSRPETGEVRTIPYLRPAAYDELLARNIIFLELFDASANNTVLEALVRTTPVVVNRHPAVQEYLGRSYPLFYDQLSQVSDLLDHARLKDAHHHLRDLDTTDLTIDHFVAQVHDLAAGLER